jgi:hypothetical protein
MNLFGTTEVTYIPFWIYNTLGLKAVSLESAWSFKEMADILTDQDIAEWEAATTIVMSAVQSSSWTQRRFLDERRVENRVRRGIQEVSDEYKLRYEFIEKLSQLPETKAQASSRLTYVRQASRMDGFYKFVSTPGGVVCVLADGFLEYLEKPGCLIDFHRAVLKELYRVYSIADASNTRYMDGYIGLLIKDFKEGDQKDRISMSGRSISTNIGEADHLFSQVMR